MSTLSLADLGPKMRQALGLETPCSCVCAGAGDVFNAFAQVVASIPVIAVVRTTAQDLPGDDGPGAAWLQTGLHRLKIPRTRACTRLSPTGS